MVRFITPCLRIMCECLAQNSYSHNAIYWDTQIRDSMDPKQNISDDLRNYAFIWDYEGKSIVHPEGLHLVYILLDMIKLLVKRELCHGCSDVAEKFIIQIRNK